MPALPRSRIPPARPRVGIHLYLFSVALVAAAIIGILLGMGSYLLVYPATEVGADYANEETRTQHPVPGSPVGEAPPSISDATPPHDEVPALPSTASGVTVPAAEVVIMPILPGATESDLSASAQSAGTTEPLHQPAAGEEPSTAHAKPTSSGPIPSAVIRGIVTEAPNAATWVLADQTIRLWGIEPLSANSLASLVDWVRAKGPIECVPRAKTDRYQCFTATGEDIAEATLLAGVARTDARAPGAYRKAEAQARRKAKGLWGKR
jgi:endonuclease YncB( thermonuclease family)